MRTCSLVVTIGILAAAALCVGAADNKNSEKRSTKAPGSSAPARRAEKSSPRDLPIAGQHSSRDADQDESEEITARGTSAADSKYPTEEVEILETAEAFVAAYAKHDAKAVAALFATEAEYIDVNGQVSQGREAIEKTLEEIFKGNPDCKLLFDIASIRFLGPNLAIEDGTTVSTTREGTPPTESRYTAIHAKADGQWQVASVREQGSSNPRQHALRLKQLDWLVGNWVDEDDDSVVHFNCRPSSDGNFLIRDFEVSLGGEKVIEGTQRIGWDPVSGRFRTWTFDSQGGYFDGYLNRDGQRWIASSSGVTADGYSASGKAIFTPVNGHTITWQAIDREVNGVPVDDSEEFTLVKKGPQPEEHAKAGE
jgi:uncharacterized protein (TIGR02246 family)